MLCAQARGGPDQASTRHEELSSQKDLCHVVSWPGGGTTWGGEWGGLGEGWVSDMGLKKKTKKTRRRVEDQCSVPYGPIAPGYGVRDVQESSTHQVKGFVRQG